MKKAVLTTFLYKEKYLRNDNSNETTLKTDWKTISDIMDANQTVLVADNKGYEYKGKISSADHRSLFINVGNDEHKAVWLPNVVKFEVVDE